MSLKKIAARGFAISIGCVLLGIGICGFSGQDFMSGGAAGEVGVLLFFAGVLGSAIFLVLLIAAWVSGK